VGWGPDRLLGAAKERKTWAKAVKLAGESEQGSFSSGHSGDIDELNHKGGLKRTPKKKWLGTQAARPFWGRRKAAKMQPGKRKTKRKGVHSWGGQKCSQFGQVLRRGGGGKETDNTLWEDWAQTGTSRGGVANLVKRPDYVAAQKN